MTSRPSLEFPCPVHRHRSSPFPYDCFVACIKSPKHSDFLRIYSQPHHCYPFACLCSRWELEKHDLGANEPRAFESTRLAGHRCGKTARRMHLTLVRFARRDAISSDVIAALVEAARSSLRSGRAQHCSLL